MFMVQPPRRHPFQTKPFWMLLSAGALLLSVWKLNWLPIHDVISTVAPLVVINSTESPASQRPQAPVMQVDAAANPAQPALIEQPSQDMESSVASPFIQPAAYEVPAAEEETPPARQEIVREASISPAEQLAAARAARAQGDDIVAHRGFSTVYWQHPGLRPSFQAELDELASRIYFQRQQHYIPAYRIEPGDHLASIARRYQLSWEYLSKLNQVQPEKIQAGRTLKVLQGPFNVIVDLNRFELTVHAFGYFVRRYPVGIGRDGATPVGGFQVVDKVVNPTYYGPDGVIAADDPANPLGERWLAINDESGSLDGYGIHGTIEPESIGKAASRGCIRMRDADLVELYDLLTVGSEVTIRR
ncbi:MAG: L,D-transpeptidase family protein [Planctomycetaceae bacterium]|nr:L,D-transpeptidase family protein [Planctomycetaceae bacterium]